MCRIIAIANQKGGVGKTTTCVNLGIGLAREGKKVLLVEADAQGSMAVSLGIQEPDELDVTLVNIMEKIINDEDVEPGEGIIHHEEGIDFIPANIELAGLETSLVNVMSREQVLRLYLDEIKVDYDYILIDCIRLPNNAFQANAGTRMNTDILFLQKLDAPRILGKEVPEWVQTDEILRENIPMTREKPLITLLRSTAISRTIRRWCWESRRSFPAPMGRSLSASP